MLSEEHREKVRHGIEALKRFLDRCFVWSQLLLPTHFLSWAMFHVARIKNEKFKDFFIGTFVKIYKVNLRDSQWEQIGNYEDFNTFFTRSLKHKARPQDPDPKALVSPVDGTISAVGDINFSTLIQAKGLDYTLDDLFGGSESAARFRHGKFCTIYLAPHNYHRIHMPTSGRLLEWSYVPGRLFSVNDLSVRKIPKLFVRNERIATVFETDYGPLGLVLVGALFVGSIETTWAGRVTPPHGQKAGVYAPMSPVVLLRGRELGRFNMGSTVIIITPERMVTWRTLLKPGNPVRVGLGLGTLTPAIKS